ncbi:MAG: hypothetical protein P9L97_05985 [Candidatus Tenebribacter davisii]|nr:hypothetical protein [Candidatus Tenebribacter davisii]
MNTFPVLDTDPASIEEIIFSTVKKAVSENRYPMIRRSGTRLMREWVITYDRETFLTTAEKSSIKTFIDANMGLFFNWTNIDTSESVVVFLNSDSITFVPLFTGSTYYTTQFTLTGV